MVNNNKLIFGPTVWSKVPSVEQTAAESKRQTENELRMYEANDSFELHSLFKIILSLAVAYLLLSLI